MRNPAAVDHSLAVKAHRTGAPERKVSEEAVERPMVLHTAVLDPAGSAEPFETGVESLLHRHPERLDDYVPQRPDDVPNWCHKSIFFTPFLW